MCTSHTTHLVPKLTAFLCPGTNFVDEFLGTSKERAKINVCNGNICCINEIIKLCVRFRENGGWLGVLRGEACGVVPTLPHKSNDVQCNFNYCR